MTPSAPTPMIEQYLAIKRQYADFILLYRMGDFYEMFFEDARLASAALEIALTSRNKNSADAVPMCGVPVKAANGYIGRLIDKGYKVAVCEQTEDPAKAKGLVQRDVVRVITPGMVISHELLDEKTNNFVLAVCRSGGSIGISSLDLSTGCFKTAESERPSAVLEEALRISPSEILLPESLKNDPFFLSFAKDFSHRAITFLSDAVFDFQTARKRLLDQFQQDSLEALGCANLKAAVSASGALLFYVLETQKRAVRHLPGIETYLLDHYLFIDAVSCRNLELLKNIQTGTRKGTLFEVIDATVTAMGGRLLKQWLRYPLLDANEINERLDAVFEAKQKASCRRSIREALKSVSDIERLESRIALGQCSARELVALKDSILALPVIISNLKGFDSGLLKWDAALFVRLEETARLIEKYIVDDPPPVVNEGGMIREGCSPELDELIGISRDGKGYLAELESKERERTGISTLKVRYNKIFGYYIEVSKSHLSSVPSHYIRKQTLVHAERYITDELKTFETRVLNAEERRAALEYEIFNSVRESVVQNNAPLMQAAGFIARLDCLMGFAQIADQNDYHRPEINTQGVIHIEDGRHPVVERMIPGGRFVPNSIHLDNSDQQVLIVTGPNMAGKSTALRQVALIVLMAHMGCFVPARHASVSLTDRIFTRVGALDNLSQGQSTFMVEMEETARIITNASAGSLVVIDEIGRGTSTFDGLSIAWAVAEFLHDLHGCGVKTLLATHYHELTQLAGIKPRVKNFSIAVKEWNDEIIFLHKMVEGGANRSYGIQVARLAGIPSTVVKRAQEVLSHIEQYGHVLGDQTQPDGEGESRKKGQVQLSLFKTPEQMIMEQLRQVDPNSITPLEALNFLSMLKKKVGPGDENSRIKALGV